jgi:hypothetical protein
MLQLTYQCQLALEWHPASHVIICVAAMVAIVFGGAVFYRFSAQMGWTEALLKAWMYVYNSPGEGLPLFFSCQKSFQGSFDSFLRSAVAVVCFGDYDPAQGVDVCLQLAGCGTPFSFPPSKDSFQGSFDTFLRRAFAVVCCGDYGPAQGVDVRLQLAGCGTPFSFPPSKDSLQGSFDTFLRSAFAAVCFGDYDPAQGVDVCVQLSG